MSIFSNGIMRTPAKALLFAFLTLLGSATASTVFAATKTICASGCDYTSISSAFASDGAAGEVYVVQGGGVSPYNPSDEAWDLNFPMVSSTLTCTGGAVITQTNPLLGHRIYLNDHSTVQGCTFGLAELSSSPSLSGDVPDGIIIRNNTFSTNASGTIELSSGATNFLISDNTNLHHVSLNATTTNGVIQNNTWYGDGRGKNSSLMMNVDATSSGLTIIGNNFLNYATSTDAQDYVSLSGENLVFASNTLRFINENSHSGPESAVSVHASGTVYFGGNFIDGPSQTDACRNIALYPVRDAAFSAIYTVTHNTLRSFRGTCGNGTLIEVSPSFDRSDINIQMNINYNIFYNASTTSLAKAAVMINRSFSSPTLTQSNSYNGVFRMTGGAVREDDGMGGGGDVSDPTTITSDPFLKLDDADTTNDLQTAGFSPYLDFNGSQDIGATSAVRRNTITISQLGTIDYATVDATTTNHVSDFVRTGDTITIATGTYAGFEVNSSAATSSVTIQGVGAGTVIDVGSGSHGITFNNVSSSSISRLVVQDAMGTSPASYTMTKILGRFSSTDYNDAFPMLGNGAGEMPIFTDASQCDAGPPYQPVASDGADITSVTVGGTTNFHLATVTIMGSNITVLLPVNQFADQSALQSYLVSTCGLPGAMFMIRGFASDLFTVSGGVYTYHPSSLADASMSLVSGVTDPPVISLTPGSPYAGINLTGTTNAITMTNVTSTGNGYGILFATTANGNNTLVDSVLTDNDVYDVLSASNATNTFDNVSFTRTSNSITGTAPILVKYKARVHTVRQGGANIPGLNATSTGADLNEVSLGTTDALGYTSYVSLVAHTITPSSSSLTNGGHNPYTMTAGGTGYSASTTGATLSMPNQTITLVMSSDQAPDAPTSAVASSLTTSSATLGWTDNSDDETSFVVDYRTPRTGQSYPGTTSYVSSDTTSQSITGLIPGETYEFRVAAINGNGTSTYATSSVFVLPAAAPTAPTVSALSRTSLSIDLGTNGNATSVQYAVYSSTLGGYLDASSTVTSTAVWQTSSTWSTITVSDLSCNTLYSFVSVGRNTSLTVTATSTAGTATTSACPSSGGGSGGGGGGGGGGGVSGLGFYIPSPVPTVSTSTPASSTGVIPPATVPPTVPPALPPVVVPPSVPTVIVPDLSNRDSLTTALGVSPDARAEQRAAIGARADAREFHVTLTDAQANRLALFIAYGVSNETRRLGEGERRALIRDMLETMQTGDLSADDMQRLATGQIPLMRNRSVEVQQLPRVRATFRTLYGHDPNFRNAEENLAWNTLMYRIRFTRNLTSEQQGIREFRSTFGRSPTTPFQWATVRVQGYVQR